MSIVSALLILIVLLIATIVIMGFVISNKSKDIKLYKEKLKNT